MWCTGNTCRYSAIERSIVLRLKVFNYLSCCFFDRWKFSWDHMKFLQTHSWNSREMQVQHTCASGLDCSPFLRSLPMKENARFKFFLTKIKAMIYFERQDRKRTKHKQQEQKKKTEAKHSYSVPSSFSKTCRFLKF